jgi:GTP pyrophosphokinase
MKKGHLGARDRRRLERAFELAVEWHAKQLRKGTSIPYLSHLVQVAGLVLEHGGGVEQAAAAFLHDALEDAPDARERAARERRIRRELGPTVLRIVLDCTDTLADESLAGKRPWKERKQRYLAHLANAPRASVLVSVCDKRHNLGTIAADVREHGVGYLRRFSGTPAEQLWYFRGILRAGGARIPSKLRAEMRALLRELAAATGA